MSRTQTFWSEVERYWNESPALAWILLLCGIGVALWASFWPQSPGVSIGILALAAGIMSVRPQMRPAEKFAWVGLLITFAILEVVAIGRSDRANEAIRDRQNDAFNVIADGLEASIKQSRTQYESTINHVNGVLTTTQSVGKLAQENLENVTGGNSYAYVAPTYRMRPTVTLRMYNHGGQILNGVILTIIEIQAPSPNGVVNPLPDTSPGIQMGTLPPYADVSVPQALTPHPDPKAGIAQYLILITEQNGTIIEGLQFKVPEWDSREFIYRLSVARDTYSDKSGKRLPWHREILQDLGWSDHSPFDLPPKRKAPQ